jgi:hypothetical protein
VVVDVGEQMCYTNELTVWQVRKIYEEKLYIDSENLCNQRRLAKITKSYIGALGSLIRCIAKFDVKRDAVSKIDELFKKVKFAE